MSAKNRLDHELVRRGLVDTIDTAKALIMAGQVSGPDRLLDKPGYPVTADLTLHVKTQSRFVSRAGDKLASVADELQLTFEGMTMLDVGSSTGGFTDFALQHGARKVYCVDVGTAQLAYKLRQDARVISLEKTDIREAELPELAELAVIDVSFIKLEAIMAAVGRLVRPDAQIVAMVKPQFEASKALADTYHGVIPLGHERDEVLQGVRDWLITHGFRIAAESNSKVSGSEGNVERFFVIYQN